MARIYRDLSQFRVVLEQLEKRFDPMLAESMRRGGQRIERHLITAAKKAAGGNRVLSGVGRPTGVATYTTTAPKRGSYLGYNVERKTRFSFLYVKTGQWQLVDSSVSEGPTATHTVKPRADVRPRPLVPAKRVAPSMKNDSGDFTRGSWTVPPQPRYPHWANAIQRVQPPIVKLTGREFDRLILNA